jgi:exonuclease SbcD
LNYWYSPAARDSRRAESRRRSRPRRPSRRVVHTADWHVGRVWKNLQRLDETAAALDHLARFIERERIDLLLMAGDVFDAGSPAAEAERLVFSFFRRVGRAGVASVVIAGNHDHPGRVDAWGTLAELVGVRTVGKPRRASKGGQMEIPTRGGERALVAALPFAPVRTWVTALELAGDETTAKARYAEMFQRAVQDVCAGFRPDTVNLLMAHTHLDGAIFGESERRVHLGDDWAAMPQALPASAQYVALGHIHKPQRVETAPVPTYYAGSPLQLDFGEAGQRKGFLVIEARPGLPIRVEEVPYEGGTPLGVQTLTLPEIEGQQARLRQAGWLRITVPLDEPDPDLARKVRALVPNALIVHPGFTQRPTADLPQDRPAAGATPIELYRAYHQRVQGEPPNDELQAAFQRLYADVQGVNDATVAVDA